MKLIGKLQDGTVFFKKGHGDDEAELFEFKTDDGNLNCSNISVSPINFFYTD